MLSRGLSLSLFPDVCVGMKLEHVVVKLADLFGLELDSDCSGGHLVKPTDYLKRKKTYQWSTPPQSIRFNLINITTIKAKHVIIVCFRLVYELFKY